MSSGGVIQEYLIGLGAQVDVKPFFTALESMGQAVAKFSLGLGAMIGALKTALVATASALETLFYTAQRAGTTVDSLKMLQFGMRQIGLSAEDASHSLESLAMAMRTNPGNESLLRHLGVETRTVSGGMRDSAAVMGDFITRLSKMPFYVATQYAAMFGINDRTLYQLLRNFGALQAAEARWRSMARTMGVDLDDSARKSQEFMSSLRELGAVVELMWLRVSTVLIAKMRPEIDNLRKFLLEHHKEIENFTLGAANALTGIVQDISSLLSIMGKLISSTIGWKNALDLVADVIAYRIFGPLGLVVEVMRQLYARLQEAEGGLTAPKRKPDGSLDEDAPETKKFFQENDEAGESFRRFLYHWMPLADPEYRKKLRGEDNNYKPSSFGGLEGQNGLPRGLLDAVWSVESGRGKHMTSSAGARGHFQFMSGTASDYGVTDPNDLAQSARGAAQYLRDLMRTFGGDLAKALAAYNWGPGNLSKDIAANGADWRAHLPSETLNYISRVGRMMAGGPLGTSPLGAGAGAGGAQAHIEQHNHFNIRGNDPKEIGHEVKRQTEMTNANLVRSFRTAVIA